MRDFAIQTSGRFPIRQGAPKKTGGAEAPPESETNRRLACYQLMRDTSWMTRAVLVPVRFEISWFDGFVLVEATGT